MDYIFALNIVICIYILIVCYFIYLDHQATYPIPPLLKANLKFKID